MGKPKLRRRFHTASVETSRQRCARRRTSPPSERHGAAHCHTPVGNCATAPGYSRLPVSDLRPAAVLRISGEEWLLPPQGSLGARVEVGLLRRRHGRVDAAAWSALVRPEPVLATSAFVRCQSNSIGEIASKARSQSTPDGARWSFFRRRCGRRWYWKHADRWLGGRRARGFSGQLCRYDWADRRPGLSRRGRQANQLNVERLDRRRLA